MLRSKSNVLFFCIFNCICFIFILATCYFIDPFCIFHKPLFRKPKFPEDNVYLNLGLIRNYLSNDYDTLLVSASYLWEMNADDISKALRSKKTLKLCLSSIFPYESELTINKACETGNVKNIVLQVDTQMWTWYSPYSFHPSRSFPIPLYQNPLKILQFPYIFDNLKTSILVCSSYLLNKNNYYFLGRPYPWRLFTNLNQLYNSWTMPEIAVTRYNNFQKRVNQLNPSLLNKFSIIKTGQQFLSFSAIDKHLVPLLKRYPNINFYIIVPPFSKNYYHNFYNKNSRNFEEIIGFFKQLVECCSTFRNVQLYGFDDCYFTLNLRNYHDLEHASPEISRFMLYSIFNKKHQLTTQNLDTYLKNFIEGLNFFITVDQLNNHMDTLEELIKQDNNI